MTEVPTKADGKTDYPAILRSLGHTEAAAGLASYEAAREFFGVSATYVKHRLGRMQDQPYCDEDLAGGPDVPEGTKCPGEDVCPGLRHKSAGWVIERVMAALHAEMKELKRGVVPQ